MKEKFYTWIEDWDEGPGDAVEVEAFYPDDAAEIRVDNLYSAGSLSMVSEDDSWVVSVQPVQPNGGKEREPVERFEVFASYSISFLARKVPSAEAAKGHRATVDEVQEHLVDAGAPGESRAAPRALEQPRCPRAG